MQLISPINIHHSQIMIGNKGIKAWCTQLTTVTKNLHDMNLWSNSQSLTLEPPTTGKNLC